MLTVICGIIEKCMGTIGGVVEYDDLALYISRTALATNLVFSLFKSQ